MNMPWTKLRFVREALAVGLDAQRSELTLRNLTGWDLASLNRALEQGTVEIVPSAEAREAKAEAWEEGCSASDTAWEHVYFGHPVPEGEICPECSTGNPYRQEKK